MKKKVLISLFILSLILSACNSPSEEDLAMASTAAAQTVEARFTQTAANTPTPETKSAGEGETEKEPTPSLTPTPTETPVPEEAPEGCLAATFVGESMPDGTIVEAGQNFTKSWSIRNDGTCTWHKGYKLVFFGGDRMGSAYEYQFFEDTPPGETMNFPIQLLAPETPGEYNGEWIFKSPSGYTFGVGEYSVPISASVDVRDPDDIEYGIVSVEYELDREPDFGCPANVHWIVNATITVSGRMTVVANFLHSDGYHTNKETLFFEEAGSKTISTDWTLYKGAGPAPRSVQVVIWKPEKFYYPTFTFVNNCPDVVD